MDILRRGGIAERVSKEEGLALVGSGVGVAEAEGRGVGEVAGEAARAHDLAKVDGVSAAGECLHLSSGFERRSGLVVRIA
jgi:hypothetical protein